jgi:hypothetical protein
MRKSIIAGLALWATFAAFAGEGPGGGKLSVGAS